MFNENYELFNSKSVVIEKKNCIVNFLRKYNNC